jgi:phosphoglucosamine mutase
MRKGDFNFGGEQSGHIVFFDYNTTGDGPITALQMLNLLRKKRRNLSDLVKKIKLYPQILENVMVSKKRNIDSIPAISKAVEKVSKDLEGRGRVLVRPSGTEPKIRIMVEGDDARLIREHAGYLSKVISKALT